SRHQATQQYGAILPIELTTAEIRNNKDYQEYYACAMGEAAPKPKASARKKKGDSASSTTPPTPTPTTTDESAPRLTASAKGEGTGSKPGVPDVPSDDSEEELSWKSFDDDEDDEEDKETGKGDDEVRESGGESEEEKETSEEEEGSFDPIPRTPKDSEKESDDEEEQESRLTFHFEERLRLLETSFSEYRQTNQFADAVSAIPGIVHQYMDQQIKEAVREAVKEQVSRILPRIEESVNATLEAEVLTRSSHSSRTSYAVAADLSKMELKKILIEKMEGNKSIQRSDEQRNLYKALVKRMKRTRLF
nr:hypothetical protein [Tanacetum cinerariifolium]